MCWVSMHIKSIKNQGYLTTCSLLIDLAKNAIFIFFFKTKANFVPSAKYIYQYESLILAQMG